MFRKKFGTRTAKTFSGFSLIELVTTVAIMAILITVLIPSLVQYVERADAQRDVSATSEMTNSVRLGMTREEVYDELVDCSKLDNVSCYIDTPNEASHVNNKTKGSYSQYSFNELARLQDETPYYAAGNMRGVTITFEPKISLNGSKYVLEDGIINKYIPSGGQKLSKLPNLCAIMKEVIGVELEQTSHVYRNSEYTIFINIGVSSDGIKIYGQYSGTNLTQEDADTHNYVTTTDRVLSDYENEPDNPTHGGEGGGGNEDGGGSGVVVVSTICDHTETDIVGATEATCTTEGHSGNEVCVECGEYVTRGKVIPAKGHSGKVVNATSATCTNNGYTGDTVCQSCGLLLNSGKTIQATGHNIKVIASANPTCEQSGYTESKACRNCGETVEEAQVIPALGHSYDAVVWEWNGVASTEAIFTCDRCGNTNTIEATIKTNATNATCESTGEIIYIATVRFDNKSYSDSKRETVAAIGHSFKTVITPPTCTEKGYTTYTCTRTGCDYSYKDDYVNALGHTPGPEATCTNDQVCTVCGEILNDKTGHDYKETVTEPTCTDGGYTTHTCTNCGDSYKDEYVEAKGHTPGEEATYDGPQTCIDCGEVIVEALEHDYDAVVTAPTCTEKGYTTYNCTTCDDSYVDNYVNALGHKPGSAATCTSAQTCTVCGAQIVAAIGHTSVNGGTATVHKKCSTCGITLATAHNYSPKVIVEATCTTKGTTKYTCSCGYSYTDQNVDVNPNNHTGTSINAGTKDVHSKYSCCGATIISAHNYSVKNTAASCTTDGIRTYTCGCGYSYTENIVATGHTEVNGGTEKVHKKCSVCGVALSNTHSYTSTVSIAATCTTKGTTKYTCSCGYSYTAQDIPIDPDNHTGSPENGGTSEDHSKYSCCDETISAEHNYTNKVTTEATCTTAGVRTYTCGCGHSYTEAIAAIGHTSVNGGTKSVHAKCSKCGTTLSSTHSYTNKVTKEATCTVDGVKTYTCNCGYSYTEAITKTGHTVGTEATCTTDQKCTICGIQIAAAKGHTEVNGGEKDIHKKCSVCGAVISATHTYTDKVTKEATCTTDGIRTYTCGCGYSYTETIAKTGHVAGTAATCTTTQTCTVCGVQLAAAKGHTEINGGTEGVHKKCSVCGTTVSTTHSYTNKVTTAATCTTDGVRTYTCGCGYSYTEPIEDTGHTSVNGGTKDVHTKCSTCGTTLSTAHSYSSAVSVAATCTTKGTTKYTCVCGYSYTDQNIAINANNHTGSAVNGGAEGVHSKYSCCGATISASHTLTNVSTSSQCRKCACGYIDTSHASVNGGTSGVHSKCSDCGYTISSTHSYTNSVTTAATCTAAGVRTYKCSCGYSYTETIAATGHTSTYGGTSSVHTKCSVCGTTLSSSHSYSYSTISYASCTSSGTGKYSCSCGYYYTTTISATGHSSTSGGTSGVHSKCSYCGTTLSSSHSYSSSVTTAATCTSSGVRTYSCGCGYSYTESIAATGHSPGSAATCTTAQTCTKCSTTITPATGHSWKAATCTEPKTCSKCGTTSGTKNGHSWDAATCTTPKTCSKCGQTSGEKLGHNYSAATCTTLQTCSRCGKTKGELASHSYSAATCTSPKTCTACGATSGSKLGHSYSAATCTKAKTCSRCGTTSGSALGHTAGAAATCGTAQTCVRCSYVYHAALGHRWITKDGKTTCNRCGITKVT